MRQDELRRKPRPSRKTNGSLSDLFREKIQSGEWPQGSQIPKEKDLAKSLNVCAATVQRHLMDLQREGLIIPKRGVGRFVAQNDERKTSGVIGVIIQDPTHLQHPQMQQALAGVGQVLTQHGKHMTIFIINDLGAKYHPIFEADGAQFENFSRDLDGAIFLSGGAPPDVYERFARRMPVVTSLYLGLSNASAICVDFASAGHLIVRYLAEKGHRKIVFFTRNLADITVRLLRDGIRVAENGWVSDGGEPLQISFQHILKSTQQEGYESINALLQKGQEFTAIVAPEMVMLGIYTYLQEQGIAVPGDVSLISISPTQRDGQTLPISSVDFDLFEAGKKRAEVLMRMLAAPGQLCEELYLPPKFTERGSVTSQTP